VRERKITRVRCIQPDSLDEGDRLQVIDHCLLEALVLLLDEARHVSALVIQLQMRIVRELVAVAVRIQPIEGRILEVVVADLRRADPVLPVRFGNGVTGASVDQ
jgi:hypothetical protein